LIKLGDNSQYAIDYLGDKNANTLTGTHSDEIFVAGAGNDTLIIILCLAINDKAP
jgi:hypothetical protein